MERKISSKQLQVDKVQATGGCSNSHAEEQKCLELGGQTLNLASEGPDLSPSSFIFLAVSYFILM